MEDREENDEEIDELMQMEVVTDDPGFQTSISSDLRLTCQVQSNNLDRELDLSKNPTELLAR